MCIIYNILVSACTFSNYSFNFFVIVVVASFSGRKTPAQLLFCVFQHFKVSSKIYVHDDGALNPLMAIFFSSVFFLNRENEKYL
jgi:hypothetical protein